MLEKEIPTLFTEKSACTGCMACFNICSVNAINMYEDKEGFFYPQIDESICVRCLRCIAVCPEKRGNI